MLKNKMRDFDYIIVGNGVGVMAAAVLLGSRQKVAVVNPSPNWGGIFGGIKINDRQFDIGMVFFEFDSFYPLSDDLSSYNPDRYNDSARFLQLVRRFWEQRLDFYEAPKVKSLLGGDFFGDIMVANQPDVLQSFSDSIKNKIAEELDALAMEKSPLHASLKHSEKDRFLAANYRDVSIANHGEILHRRLFGPFCRKVLGVCESEITALFHRAAWCPLYYPETLLSAIRGEKLMLPDTRFYYPKGGHFALTVETLSAEMSRNKNITLIRDKPVGMTASAPALSFTDDKITAKKIIWGGDLGQLLPLLDGAPPPPQLKKSSITMVFAETDKKPSVSDFSTAFVCDEDECIYRMTRQGESCAELPVAQFVFEINGGILQEQGIDGDDEIISHVKRFVKKTEVFDPENGASFTVRHFNNALTLPTSENFEKFKAAKEAIGPLYDNINYIGSAAGFAGGSFNDQIVSALQLEEKYGTD